MQPLHWIGLLLVVGANAQNDFERVAKTPPALSPSLVYDPTRNELVLFGGGRHVDDGWTLSDETWVFDGEAWSERSGTARPPSTFDVPMAFDAARREVVMLSWAATWIWDGAAWSTRASAHRPESTLRRAVAYDSARDRVVAFGGDFLPVDSTFEWDGIDWLERHPIHSPPAGYAALAYDVARSVTIAVTTGGQTWEWDGDDWTQRASVPLAATPHRHVMAYDPVRNRTVVVWTEAVGTTRVFEYDGSAWTDETPTDDPGGRNAPIAFDSSRGQLLRFGGERELNPFRPARPDLDLLAWQNGAWALVSRRYPKPVVQHAAVYDAARGEVVVFGGRDVATELEVGETWVFDASLTWTWRNPSFGPTARAGAAMAYDTRRAHTVLFGGEADDVRMNDTWIWDGTEWTRLAPVTAPRRRIGHSMAYDAARDEVVMFGGHDDFVRLRETWVWDGTNWQQRAVARSPTNLVAHSMSYDAQRGRIRLVEASSYWEWDGVDWTETSSGVRVEGPGLCIDDLRGVGYTWNDPAIHAHVGVGVGTALMRSLPSTSPPPDRHEFSAVYHAAIDRIVLSGAARAGVQFVFADTWLYRPGEPALFGNFGAGCAGTHGVPRFAAVGDPGVNGPVVGTSFAIGVQDLPPSRLNVPIVVLGFERSAPIDLTAIGMTNCRLLTLHDLSFIVPNQLGFAVFDLVIPNQLDLVGQRVFAQSFVIESGANPLGVIASDACEIRLGLVLPE